MSLTRPGLALGAISLATLGLALVALGEKSLWLDEGYSVSYASLGLGDLVDVASQHQANMSLYYLLLHFWLGLGDGEASIRLLSAFLAVATVPVVYAVGRRLYDAPTGLVAALLFGTNPFVIRYAQEARGYTLALFLVCAATYFFVTALEGEGLARWAAWGSLGGLACYAHFFSGFVILAHVLTLMAGRRDRGWRQPAAGAAIFAVVVAPLFAFVVWRSAGQINWIPEPSPGDLPGAMADLSGGGLLAVLHLCLAIYAAVRVARTKLSGINLRGSLILPAAWLLVPLLGSFALSYVKPIFLSKYVIVALPGLLLLVAKGVRDLVPVVARGAVAVALVALTAWGLGTWYSADAREPWRDVVTHVVDDARAGDGLILYSSRIWNPVNYYVSNRSLVNAAPDLIYPDTGWGRVVPDNTPPVISDVLRASAGYERVWLVLGYADGNRADEAEALEKALRARSGEFEQRRFRRIRVLLYD